MFDNYHVSSKNSVFNFMGTFFDWNWNKVLSHLWPYEWFDLLCKVFWGADPLFLCEGGLQPQNWNPKSILVWFHQSPFQCYFAYQVLMWHPYNLQWCMKKYKQHINILICRCLHAKLFITSQECWPKYFPILWCKIDWNTCWT